MSNFISIEEALVELSEGKMIILVDDERRENEGDLMFAADKVTPEAINFMAKNARGQICLALDADIIKRLHIPLMPERNKLPNQARFTASIEAAKGVTTGVSAFDRAHTINVAMDPSSTPNDLSLPGHIFPLQARKGGILERAGHTEASVDMAKLAGFQGGAVICEIMNDDGTMARLADLELFAIKNNIKLVAINDLITYRLKKECIVEEKAEARLPLSDTNNCIIKIFQEKNTGLEHIALIYGDLEKDQACLVRIHSECLTGDVFGSLRCDCGEQLNQAKKRMAKEGGIILYMRQEGRGIGLSNKIKTYQLQQNGLDTVEANEQLGFAPDHRNYAVCCQILKFLGVEKIRLLTNNPSKITELEQFGITVIERIALETLPNPSNQAYLKTKRHKLGHLLTLTD